MKTPLERITQAVQSHGLDAVTSELLKQAGLPFPEVWNLKTAALTVTLKMAENRQTEQSIKSGLASYLKVTP